MISDWDSCKTRQFVPSLRVEAVTEISVWPTPGGPVLPMARMPCHYVEMTLDPNATKSGPDL